MTENERACEFEALICEVQALAIEVEGMKSTNKQREIDGCPLAYDEMSFNYYTNELRNYAKKFRELGRK